MEGKQVRFYMVNDDEQKFTDFLNRKMSSVLITPTASAPKPRFIKLPLPSVGKSLKLNAVLIWNPKFPIRRKNLGKFTVRKLDKEQKAFIKIAQFDFDYPDVPVIQFDRSFIYDGKLLQGRLWASMYEAEGHTFVRRSREFEAWYDRIARWIRRHGKRIKGLDGYFLEAAYEWYKKGGKLQSV